MEYIARAGQTFVLTFLLAASFGCADGGSGIEAQCGNGLVEGMEACDDGNTSSGDGCSNQCVVEDGYVCIGSQCGCSSGFYGPNCLACPDCGPRGVCQDGSLGDGGCLCEAGYGGVDCLDCMDGYQRTNDGVCEPYGGCDEDSCSGRGLCSDSEGPVVCECLPGFEGTECEIDIDECEAAPCANGGVCSELESGGYECACLEGFEGVQCETDIDD